MTAGAEVVARSRRVDSTWMLSSGVVQGAIAFGVNLVLVRFVEPAGFGRWALAMAGVSLALSVLSLRLGVQLIRLRDEELDGEARRAYFTAILAETLVASVASAAWLAADGLLDAWTGLLIVALGLRHVVTSARAFFEREAPYRKLAVAEGVSAGASQVVACAAVLLGAGAAALYLREAALTLALLLTLRAAGGLRWEGLAWLGPRAWSRLVRRTGGLWLDGMLEGVFERLLVLAAGFFGGTVGAGLFFQARSLALLPHRLMAPVVGRMSLTWFSRAETGAARRDERDRLLRVLLPGLLVLAVATALLARPVVPWLLGPGYAEAAELLVALAGTVLAFGLFASLKAYLLSARRVRLLLMARVAQFTGLALPLAPWLAGGEVGVGDVALGTSLAYLLALVTAAFLAREPAPVRPPAA